MTERFADIHSHILARLDDGARSETESRELLRLAHEEGIGFIVATPHVTADRPLDHQEAEAQVHKLQLYAATENLGIEVFLGSEIRISGEMLSDLKKGKLISLAHPSRFILVEFPFTEVPYFTRELLFGITLEGLTPVLAHPERNSAICRNPEIVKEFAELGCLVQLTCSSIVGLEGSGARRCARALIRQGTADLVASDAHKPGHRLFHFREAHSVLARWLGEEKALQMTCILPKKLIEEGRTGG